MLHFTFHIKQIRRALYWAVLSISISSCSEGDESLSSERYMSIPIRWEITNKPTRAVIDSPLALQTACTPVSDGGEGMAISVYGTHSSDGGTVVTDFDGVPLIYASKGSTAPHMWNYHVADRYWSVGSIYDFFAYYPASANGTKNVTSTSLSISNYSTMQQEDLMTAYRQVNTADADFDPTKGVPMTLRHALSSVSFQLKLKDNGIAYTNAYQAKSVSISNVYTQGDVSVNRNGAFSITPKGTLGSTGSITDFDGAGVFTMSSPASSGSLLVMPQQSAAAQLNIELEVNGNAISIQHDNWIVDWLPEHQYTYIIEIDPIRDISITVVTTQWEEPDISDIIIPTE